MEYGTIKIPREEFERHNERRQSLGLSWAEYLDGQAPDGPEPVDAEALVEDLVMQLPPAVADELAERQGLGVSKNGP